MNNNLIVDKLLMYTIECDRATYVCELRFVAYMNIDMWNKRDSVLLVFNAIGCKYCLNGFL